MSTIQQGDILIFQTVNDGDINIVNGIAQSTGGIPNAVYLSLFGGNESDDGINNNDLTWWGNRLEDLNVNKYVSETQNLLRSLPSISSNLLKLEQAALRDLDWLLELKVASSIDMFVSIPALNRVKIDGNVNAEGREHEFSFIENWKVKK